MYRRLGRLRRYPPSRPRGYNQDFIPPPALALPAVPAMGLVRLALGNVYAVVVLALIIMVLGAVAIVSLPVDILPAFKTPAVQVLTYYNAMPAESVEKTITNRIERWVNQAPGARLVESRSVPGVSVVKVYFRDEVDPNGALTLTTSLALGTLPTLPPNTFAPVV